MNHSSHLSEMPTQIASNPPNAANDHVFGAGLHSNRVRPLSFTSHRNYKGDLLKLCVCVEKFVL